MSTPKRCHDGGSSNLREDDEMQYTTGIWFYTPKNIAWEERGLIDIRNTERCVEALVQLGELLGARFNRHGHPEDIKNAIRCDRFAIYLTSENHAELEPSLLNHLGNLYMSKFERNGQLADINNSIIYLRRAMLLTPDQHEDKLTSLGNLGIALTYLFEHHGEISAINQAIELLSQVVLLTPDNHLHKPSLLSNLGSSYQSRGSRVGSRSDIINAIECLSRAIQLIPSNHPDKPSLLNNLGNAYRSSFNLNASLADIDEAINCQIQAVHHTPDGSMEMLTRLSNLGIAYQCRFELMGDIADINKAIEYHTQVVLLAPEDHARRATWLSDLGNSYDRRFDRLGESAEPSDVEQAITFHRQAALLTSNHHQSKPDRLNNLGIAHWHRYRRYGNVSDIDDAIRFLDHAVLLTPPGDAGRPGRLNNLGAAYQARFEQLGNLEDIATAIDYLSQATHPTPDGHAKIPSFLGNLAHSYMLRYDRQGQLEDAERANISFEEAAQSAISDPRIQFKAARQWARSSVILGISPLLAYQKAMELVPEFVWLGNTIEQQYGLLKEVGDIVMEAASCAIILKEYDRALEWLEAGRSIIWNQILQLRTPLETLSTVNFSLAERLKQISRGLEDLGSTSRGPFSSTHGSLDREKDNQRHHILVADWRQALEEARLIPGFKNFMSSLTSRELLQAAKDGPIIVINLHRYICSGLVVLPNAEEVAHVPLQSYSYEKALDAHAKLIAFLRHPSIRARGFKRVGTKSQPAQFPRDVMKTLWLEVVKPVFDFLGYTHKLPTDELPHVTWCATGPLQFLPFHAAGCYDGSQNNTFDFVVSSYTPTLAALLASTQTCDSRSGLLAVGQENTQGFAPLEFTRSELSVIKNLAQGTSYLQLDGCNATVEAVLREMDRHSWVHLACHATQNSDNPSQSAFHLHDGGLTLQAITRKSFRGKGLAFLSACQTATGDESLPEEAMHLAAGLLMAGYPSVIATMWAIQDEDGPEVAQIVYADLLKNVGMDATKAARALHKAVARLRGKGVEDQFHRWAPFIHVGA